MRIESMEGDAFITLNEWTVDKMSGDLSASVNVRHDVFSGGAQEAWFFREDVLAFIAALNRLAQTHEGEARLESMSPGEVVLHVERLDLARHLVLHAIVSATSYVRDRLFNDQVSISFEVGPVALNQTALELAAILNSG